MALQMTKIKRKRRKTNCLLPRTAQRPGKKAVQAVISTFRRRTVLPHLTSTLPLIHRHLVHQTLLGLNAESCCLQPLKQEMITLQLVQIMRSLGLRLKKLCIKSLKTWMQSTRTKFGAELPT
ncbi:unnamed protein product [Staurois parvus]|uniref:Uncharacterized protein n=1 Tax=Staurois parvus TaxID=386267 RepID=A0ABN9GB74_9NEOB|nr:unnamed protein product [Staurois parvus]